MSAAPDSPILLERQDGIAIITLNRPQVLNAWHKAMREQLIAAFDTCENDPDVRAIVTTGSGERGYCAGQDLNDVVDFDEVRARAWIEEWRTLYMRIRTLTKPTVAALNGVAAGSGFQFALLQDFRIGHAGSRMGQPEINAGIASITGPWIIREVLGLARTTELALSGRMLSGEEAYRYGMIHELVQQDAVMPRALELAAELAQKAPLAMRLNKNWLREMTQAGFDAAFAHALEAHAESYRSGEPQRSSRQFLGER